MKQFCLGVIVAIGLTVPAFGQGVDPLIGRQSAEPSMEEIYIVRSVRESRILASTEFCRTGLDNPVLEDQFTMRSVATNASDGRVLDATKTIGSVRFCQEQTAKPFVSVSYGEFSLGQLTFKARGDCSRIKADFPEPGLSPYSCVFDLSGLPSEYVGGQLTTNTMSSAVKFIGPETDPPGYIQNSIATIRLWKKRVQ